MRIDRVPEVARNLTAQLEWIAERDPRAATDIGDAVRAAAARLSDHPTMGRPGRIRATRELVVSDALQPDCGADRACADIDTSTICVIVTGPWFADTVRDRSTPPATNDVE